MRARKSSFIKLPRFVIDARAKELAFKFTVEQITLRQKKLARSGLRLRQRIAHTPISLKLRLGLITTLQAILDLLLAINPDIRRVVRQVIRRARREHRRATIAVEREEPNTRHAVVMNVSTNVQLVH